MPGKDLRDEDRVFDDLVARFLDSPEAQEVLDEVHRIAMSAESARHRGVVFFDPDLRSVVNPPIPVFPASGIRMTEVALQTIRRAVTPGLSARVREIFDHVIRHRLREARWWLPDHIDPAQPTQLRGLDEVLSARRRQSIDEYVHALEQWLALLHYRHRRLPPDSPGHLVAARRRVPRGPNFRRLTSLSQPAGFVVRA